MSLTINLDIGHTASLRTKKTQEGFTHDWEVYVKGCNGADIQHYVEKIVFNLHETFAKPKRGRYQITHEICHVVCKYFIHCDSNVIQKNTCKTSL